MRRVRGAELHACRRASRHLMQGCALNAALDHSTKQSKAAHAAGLSTAARSPTTKALRCDVVATEVVPVSGDTRRPNGMPHASLATRCCATRNAESACNAGPYVLFSLAQGNYRLKLYGRDACPVVNGGSKGERRHLARHARVQMCAGGSPDGARLCTSEGWLFQPPSAGYLTIDGVCPPLT